MNGIHPFEEEMTFYYDDSGNCRKFSLTDAGFNNTDALKGDFVLAGVAHEGRSFDIDVPSLYAALDYKEGQKELKFKHLFHNSKDFQSFIGSKRATGFLEWLIRSGLYIHYSALNNLYYSLVDIVDSLWETHPQWLMYMWDIKGALEMSRNVQSGNTQNLKSSVAPVRLPAAPASTPGTSQAVAQAGCVYRP